jgi:hypothetical protein
MILAVIFGATTVLRFRVGARGEDPDFSRRLG